MADPALTNTAITIGPTPKSTVIPLSPEVSGQPPPDARRGDVYVSSRYKTRVPPRPSPALPSTMMATTTTPAVAAGPAQDPRAALAAAPSAAPVVVPGASERAAVAAPAAAVNVTKEEGFRLAARLQRQDAKVQAERRALDEQKRADAEQTRAGLEAQRRLAVFDQVGARAQQDPIGLLRAYGVQTQTVLNQIIGDAGLTPQQKSAKELAAITARQAAIEAEVKRNQERFAAEEQQRKVVAYIATNVAPLFADPTAYPGIMRAAAYTGADPASHIWNLQWEHYKETGITVPAKDIADSMEALYAKKEESLRGGSAAAPHTVKPARATEPAQSRDGSQATTATIPGTRRQPPKAAYRAIISR
jgi:hypothetical protein